MLFNKQKLARGLTLAAAIVATEIRRITSRGGKGGYPKQIPAGINVDTAKMTDVGGSIGIFTKDKDGVDDDDTVALTLAFELGAKPHRIEPKGNYPLKISRASWPKYKPPPDADPLYFMWVDHPGMQPRPFLGRAMQASTDKVLDVLDQSFEFQILDGPKVEVIK